jgi:hypothetical protein
MICSVRCHERAAVFQNALYLSAGSKLRFIGCASFVLWLLLLKSDMGRIYDTAIEVARRKAVFYFVHRTFVPSTSLSPISYKEGV